MPADIAHGNPEVTQILAAIVESSHDAIISKDLNGIITSWNSGATHLFGYSPDEIVGRSVTILIPPDRQAEETHILGLVRRGERVVSYETIRQRKDGSFVEVSLTVSPVRDSENRVVGASKIARDISELNKARKQQDLLLGEMKHRVKNLLAVMDAIGRNAIPKGDQSVENFFAEYMGRMSALLSVGEIVVSSSLRQAELGELARTTLTPFISDSDPNRIRIEGPELRLSENTAGGMALALHELATNALKYGALKTDNGKVDLRWSVSVRAPNERLASIVWKEQVAHSVEAPAGRGFGSRLINMAVAGEKSGKTNLQFEPDGLRCVFEFLISP